MIKLQFYHPSAGTLTVKPDAEGTDDFEQTMKRSDQTDGVIFEYSLDLKFTKKAKAYLETVFENSGGIEAIVVVNAFEYMPNDFKWEQIGAGTIKYTNQEIADESFKTSIEQTGFQRKVLNLMDTDVDMNAVVSQGGAAIPATPSFNMTLHSKAIIKETTSMPSELIEIQKLDAVVIGNIPGEQTTFREVIVIGNLATDKQALNELKDSFSLPFAWAEAFPIGLGMGNVPADEATMVAFLEANKEHRFPVHIATENEELDIDNILPLLHRIVAINNSGDIDINGLDGALGDIEIYAWYELRDAADNILDLQSMGSWDMSGGGDNERIGDMETKLFALSGINLTAGQKVYLYTTTRIFADYENTDAGSEDVTHHFHVTPGEEYKITLKAKTTTAPSTTKSYLIFEALNKVFQFYSDQTHCFESDYFGRTDSVIEYPVDGAGSLNTIQSGALIRKVAGKTTFANGNDLFGALNAMHCLGLGFEIRNGRQVVVINPLQYFYNENLHVLDLGPVSKFKEVVDTKSYANQFEQAYGKIDIQKTNGIDDFSGKRNWKYPITQVSNKQLATTKYKISADEIENQRRLISSTEDSKNDDNNFFIKVVRIDDTFKPATNEDYTLIENLFDPASTYNLDLSLRRNLDNWLGVIAIALYKSPTKEITFASGEGNYNMITQKTGEPFPKPEGGLGVKVSLEGIKPLWHPKRYKFECPLTSLQMKVIRQNPYGYYTFQRYRGGPNWAGFLSKVTRSDKKKTGTFELLKKVPLNG
jgi:hypothetical protein